MGRFPPTTDPGSAHASVLVPLRLKVLPPFFGAEYVDLMDAVGEAPPQTAEEEAAEHRLLLEAKPLLRAKQPLASANIRTREREVQRVV